MGVLFSAEGRPTVSETRTIRLAAPAKVNLTLDVDTPRPDGFHDLDSIVLLLWPADKIRLSLTVPRKSLSISCYCSDSNLPTDDKNLAVRAARLFCESFGFFADIVIHLTKRLPAQAGLGGGSSDAAAVLLGLRTLAPFAVSENSLLEIAAQIGSDVPLFLLPGGVVQMQGRGEVVTPLDTKINLHGVLVRPDVGVSTPMAYRLLDEIPGRVSGNATSNLLAALQTGETDATRIAPLLANDFEAAVFPAFPAIEKVAAAMEAQGMLRVLLCGSGSCLFGLAHDSADARRLARALSGQFPFVRRAQGFFK